MLYFETSNSLRHNGHACDPEPLSFSIHELWNTWPHLNWRLLFLVIESRQIEHDSLWAGQFAPRLHWCPLWVIASHLDILLYRIKIVSSMIAQLDLIGSDEVLVFSPKIIFNPTLVYDEGIGPLFAAAHWTFIRHDEPLEYTLHVK